MELVENKNLLESVDARTRLAGSNKMEILLFLPLLCPNKMRGNVDYYQEGPATA